MLIGLLNSISRMPKTNLCFENMTVLFPLKNLTSFFFFNHWSSPFRVFFFVRLLYVNKSFGCKLVNEFNPVGFVQFSLMLIYSKMHKK